MQKVWSESSCVHSKWVCHIHPVADRFHLDWRIVSVLFLRDEFLPLSKNKQTSGDQNDSCCQNINACATVASAFMELFVWNSIFFIPVFQVSTHGYSQHQILVWKYPSLVQIAKLTGHSYRVLYLAMSPDGEAIVTGAGDETLRFWNVFSKTRSTKVRV